MFHTIINLAYIIPNIYVYLRIRRLFINRGYKVYYTLIYLLLASIYPLSNLFPERYEGFLSGALKIIADYLLPYYLYLFLIVLLFDIFLLINRLFKIIPADQLKNTRFKVTGLSSILFFSALIVVAGVINFNTIRTSEYRIEIPGKSSGISRLKIAFAADFHLEKGINMHFVQRFADKIAEINPDLMVFGGDIVEGDREDEIMTDYEKILSEIKNKIRCFCCTWESRALCRRR